MSPVACPVGTERCNKVHCRNCSMCAFQLIDDVMSCPRHPAPREDAKLQTIATRYRTLVHGS
jgi:hypothetical protein